MTAPLEREREVLRQMLEHHRRHGVLPSEVTLLGETVAIPADTTVEQVREALGTLARVATDALLGELLADRADALQRELAEARDEIECLREQVAGEDW